MSHTIKIHEVPPSPNNQKVRLALGYKKIPYERVILEDFGDRASVIAATTQPLTPAMEYGPFKLFDSHAILRFLDASFPDTPRLYSEDYSEIKEIEGWELFARTELGRPVGMVFGGAQDPDNAPSDLAEKATAFMHEATGPMEETLAESDFLVGNRLTAADLTTMPLVLYATLPEGAAELGPIMKYFHDHLKLGEGRERTRAWVERIVAYDPHSMIQSVGA